MENEKGSEMIPQPPQMPAQGLNAIIQQVDPVKEVEYAQRCAEALMKIINAKPKKVVMNGETYLEFEDWQTIARFYRLSVGTDWTKEIKDEQGNVTGYDAKAAVFFDGKVVGGAEASCNRDEKNWSSKPDFQLKSMAQTRACAKALRNVLGYVPVLAGYKATPAEEILDDQPFPSHTRTAPIVTKTYNAPAPMNTNPQSPVKSAPSPRQWQLIKKLFEEKMGIFDPSDEQYSNALSRPVTKEKMTVVDASDLIKKLISTPAKQNNADAGN